MVTRPSKVIRNVCLSHHWSLQGTWGEYTCITCHLTHLLKPIQFEFVKQLSEDPQNLVIGLVRDKTATEKKVAAELSDRTNVHVVYGDLSSHASLKQAAADSANIVGERGIDYLVANGAYLPLFDAYDPIGAL